MASLPLCSSVSSSPLHLLNSLLYSPSSHALALHPADLACAKPLKNTSHRISRRTHKSMLVKSAGTGSEILTSDAEDSGDGDKVGYEGSETHRVGTVNDFSDGDRIGSSSSPGESPSLGIRDPVYEVIEVSSDGVVSTRKINRRQLLKSSGLRPRDIRSVDPSLWLTNSMPALLVREHAILLNMGSLRAIAMQECVYIFNYNKRGGKAFLDSLLPRLNPKSMNGVPSMPFELEVVEAALHSKVQRLEQRLMDLEPNVQALLEVLPNRLTADVLEKLRISKQTLVELGSRSGELRQMLLDLLEDPHEIRRICVMGRNCTLKKGNNDMECSLPLEKQIAEEEEEEIEMLLENYLQRCESCHSQAERLLDSAREMEDSISVNLSSRRLEVSRVELLLQVGAFCVAVGALVSGIADVFYFIFEELECKGTCISIVMKPVNSPKIFSMTHSFIGYSYIWHEFEVLPGRAGSKLFWGFADGTYLEKYFLLNLLLHVFDSLSRVMQFAFWLTTSGIIVSAVVAFYFMYWYLRKRKIL